MESTATTVTVSFNQLSTGQALMFAVFMSDHLLSLLYAMMHKCNGCLVA